MQSISQLCYTNGVIGTLKIALNIGVVSSTINGMELTIPHRTSKMAMLPHAGNIVDEICCVERVKT